MVVVDLFCVCLFGWLVVWLVLFWLARVACPLGGSAWVQDENRIEPGKPVIGPTRGMVSS